MFIHLLPVAFDHLLLPGHAARRPCQVIGRSLAAMRERGVKVVFGRWLIDGNPMVVLFDVDAAMGRAAEWKKVNLPSQPAPLCPENSTSICTPHRIQLLLPTPTLPSLPTQPPALGVSLI